jgi:hypothetical protein
MGQVPYGLDEKKRVGYACYDFAKDGGAIAPITISDKIFPAGAIISEGMIFSQTAMVSGGATTVDIGVEGAQDVVNDGAKASFAANAMVDVIPAGTAATAIRCTADRAVVVTPAVAAITAGKFLVALEYYVAYGM